MIRLPDAPPDVRIRLLAQTFTHYGEEELSQAVITVKGSRIRISHRRPPDAKER